MLFGRPGGAALPVEDHRRYDEAILGVVRDECGLDEIAIVAGLDFGHTDPMWTLPQGVVVRVDPATETVTFLEPGVA